MTSFLRHTMMTNTRITPRLSPFTGQPFDKCLKLENRDSVLILEKMRKRLYVTLVPKSRQKMIATYVISEALTSLELIQRRKWKRSWSWLLRSSLRELSIPTFHSQKSILSEVKTVGWDLD